MDCNTVTLVCRAVDLGKADVNTRFAYMLEDELKGKSVFISTNMLQGQLVPEGRTFTFQLHVILKNPLKL